MKFLSAVSRCAFVINGKHNYEKWFASQRSLEPDVKLMINENI